MDSLITVHDLSKSIQSKTLFENISFDIYPDNCIGLLGPNGCGKTTLFKILLGREQASSGELFKKENLRIRYLDQVPLYHENETILDYFNRTMKAETIQKKIREYEKQLEKPEIYHSNQYIEILDQIQKLKVTENRMNTSTHWESACLLLEEIGFVDILPATKPSNLSGGEFQKIALANVLAQPKECDLLLLDEPTNHLDIETIEWLERKIVDFPNAVMLVSHDRYLLDDLVDRVFEIEGSSLEIYNTTYEEYEEQKKLRTHIKKQAYEKYKTEVKRQQKVIETVSRRNRYDLQIASKIKRLKRMNRVENPIIKEFLLKFHFKSIVKSGKNVAEGKNLAKYFDNKRILYHLNFEILAGQKIGLIGPNGCGKTTFLKILNGEEHPTEGKIHISSGVKIGYFDQGHLSLNPKNNLIDELRRDQNEISENDAKALLGQFNFKDTMVYKQVKQLSGGERARLAILRLILQPYNFILLDEPTNHMDMESKKAIEIALNSYMGTVIAVSHDRKFLDMVTDTIFFMENGSIKTYMGNYTSFRMQRIKELDDLSAAKLAYLSGTGVKKYIVYKGFTIWTTKTKHTVGEEVYIGDHNKKLYEWAIKSRCLRLADYKEK
ncbi:MAG: ABC-F family ATP-binding cassette domain-containing protein [Thermoplasmatota archaeon]